MIIIISDEDEGCPESLSLSLSLVGDTNHLLLLSSFLYYNTHIQCTLWSVTGVASAPSFCLSFTTQPPSPPSMFIMFVINQGYCYDLNVKCLPQAPGFEHLGLVPRGCHCFEKLPFEGRAKPEEAGGWRFRAQSDFTVCLCFLVCWDGSSQSCFTPCLPHHDGLDPLKLRPNRSCLY